MQTKKEYKCDLCNQKKECYVFEEFNIPFSLCKDCYVKLELEKDSDILAEDKTCQLCDNTRACYKFHHLHTSFLRSNILICEECFEKLEKLIEQEEKKKYKKEKEFVERIEEDAEKRREEE
ncbi:hypothetical protein JW949_03295 [Candidatus Woesearchaeota archaeon]|jgi:hypothetical protein|nr:hypothetical protein [Candidatus Woesearchaeota archaeon]